MVLLLQTVNGGEALIDIGQALRVELHVLGRTLHFAEYVVNLQTSAVEAFA